MYHSDEKCWYWGGCACEDAECIWEHFVISGQFCYGPKTVLKKKSQLKKEHNMFLSQDYLLNFFQQSNFLKCIIILPYNNTLLIFLEPSKTKKYF